MRDLLDEVSGANNRFESAHNAMMADFARRRATYKDASIPVTERQRAYDTNMHLFHNYAEVIQPYLDAYDPDTLPADLPTLKALLIERLEAAAMGRVKEIKGAKTQQGVDIPAACLDIANAVEEVSRKCALGIQNIDDAADNAAAQGAYNTAVGGSRGGHPAECAGVGGDASQRHINHRDGHGVSPDRTGHTGPGADHKVAGL